MVFQKPKMQDVAKGSESDMKAIIEVKVNEKWAQREMKDFKIGDVFRFPEEEDPRYGTTWICESEPFVSDPFDNGNVFCVNAKEI